MILAGLGVRAARVFACLTIIFAGALAHAQPGEQGADARQLWQLLDYVAVDYSGAVQGGEIISEGEYAEMLEFTDTAASRLQALPATDSKDQIAALIQSLGQAVRDKADAAHVAELAHEANALLLKAYPMPVAPAHAPDLQAGARLYAAQCASCHGAGGAGDGVAAAGLDPAPIAFTDAERAASRSVLALYQVISQGVEGTSMPAFAELSDDERWALAFFAGGMAYDDAMRKRGEDLWNEDPEAKALYGDLEAIATTSQAEASRTFEPDAARDLTAFVRAEPSVAAADDPSGLSLARQRLGESLQALRKGEYASASSLALSAYLDGFEPIEPMLGARNPRLLTEVEDAMLAYRSAVGKRDAAAAEQVAGRLDGLFGQVDAELGQAQAAPLTTFLGALTILLREGLEALLIVIGIVAFLKKADRPDALKAVHTGWVLALVAGALTWVAATYLVTISGASRELTEGLGSLLAAVVLLGVGLWMHQKSAAGRWQAYLHQKVSGAMRRRSAWGLFALAFIAVYREVFETVLFYSALATDGNGAALLAGFGVAVVLLALIAWILLRTSARMPIGKFFSLTSILVALLAIVLTGKGVSALQEAGWIDVLPVAAPRIEILGVYPTLQTLAAQAVVLLVVAAGFGFQRRSRISKG
ncbi:cytochrome c/FTR1 family iron permease [Pusillimonas sp.]|uniref:cytochrome c/FTR1 family iron permease n=1 Tax=Pusillimonas sp. TaxID=3040095 RepID=UPI0029AA4A6A|nr:cytochrome c/FTR1 family iron permease [Pusillimonas sp.]MDX3893969.1 cytochrome c/FTR1 family iron permease [Pusillimonas sp.]